MTTKAKLREEVEKMLAAQKQQQPASELDEFFPRAADGQPIPETSASEADVQLADDEKLAASELVKQDADERLQAELAAEFKTFKNEIVAACKAKGVLDVPTFLLAVADKSSFVEMYEQNGHAPYWVAMIERVENIEEFNKKARKTAQAVNEPIDNAAAYREHANNLPTVQAPSMPDVAWDRDMMMADTFFRSELLPSHIKNVYQARVIMEYGRALHMPDIIALNTLQIIKGKVTVPPAVMMAKAYQTKEVEDFQYTDENDTATVMVKRKGMSPVTDTFSMEDARKLTTVEWENGKKRTIPLAEGDAWKKQAKVMRKWRCVSAVLRLVFADALMGLYTSEELGAQVMYDDQGNEI